MENVEVFTVQQVSPGGRHNREATLAKEIPFTIFFNDEELVTLLCSPSELKYLTCGFLFSEGLLQSRDEVKKLLVDARRGLARLETREGKGIDRAALFKRVIATGCGRGASFYRAADTAPQKVTSMLEITTAEVFALVSRFQHTSELYLRTHGVHSAALAERKAILAFSEDIGRHNAIDKVFGKCLLEGIPTKDGIILTSGRISSEILHKIARSGIPVIISISVPTDLAVKLADSLGITLIGSVRGSRHMTVYTHGERVVAGGESCSLPAPLDADGSPPYTCHSMKGGQP